MSLKNLLFVGGIAVVAVMIAAMMSEGFRNMLLTGKSGTT